MIVWLASYPRSGNTYLRILLKECFSLETFSQYDDKNDIGASEAFANLVGHKALEADWAQFYEQARESTVTTPIKTHDAPRDKEKAIYLVRDPRAVVVSFYHYFQNYGQLRPTLTDLIFGATSYKTWRDHLEAWRPDVRENTLLLRYEDVLSDSIDAIRRVGEFLKIEPIRYEAPCFEQLHKSQPKFFHSGSNEKNINELSDSQKALISFLYGDEMARFGYAESAKYERTLVLSELSAQAARQNELRQSLVQMGRIESRRAADAKKTREMLERIQENNAQNTQRLKEISDHSFKISSQLECSTQELAKLNTARAQLDATVEKLKLANARLETEKAVLVGEKAVALSEIAELERRLGRERMCVRALTELQQAQKERIEQTEHALEPRLKSIISLKPLRYALAERNRIKAGGEPFRISSPAEALNDGDSAEMTAEAIIAEVRERAERRGVNAVRAQAMDLGIAVFAHNRAKSVANVLHALELQGATDLVHVWIDGDQGNPARRSHVDVVYDCVSKFRVKAIHRNRGNFGFRKMILLAMRKMMEQHEKILFLEDDCFPTRDALSGFDRALAEIADNPAVFSVYGHPFGFPGEKDGSTRFQGWGWATTSAKLKPVWGELMECYLKTEEEYLAFVRENLTAEIRQRIDVTPGRQPSDTLEKFFAWDETLCLLTAVKRMNHQLTSDRLIYNFGAGSGAAHFHKLDFYRKPPFNMVSMDEVWDYY